MNEKDGGYPLSKKHQKKKPKYHDFHFVTIAVTTVTYG